MSQQQILLKKNRESSVTPTSFYPLDVGSPRFGWGLNRLSSSYSGSVVRLRDLSNSTELDVGLAGDDLDTASIDSWLSPTADIQVVRLFDQSGNGNHSTYDANNGGGLYVDGTLHLVNGKPAIEVTGPQFFDAAITFSVGSGVAFYVGELSGNSMFSSQGASGGYDGLAVSGNSSGAASPSGAAYRVNGSPVAGVTRGNLYSALGTFSPFIAAVLGYDYGTNYGTTYRLCGRSIQWRGFVQSAMVWDSDVSANVADIEGYINNFHGHY